MGALLWFTTLAAATPRATDNAISAIAATATVVSSGRLHSCAVVSGGVQCWGDNSNGQLGNNSTVGSLIPVQAIVAGSGVTAISASGFHSCAVVSGGVKCWGENSSGQLGNGGSTPSLVPVTAIAAGSNVTAVSAGGAHTCAAVGGGVQCWGSNFLGQLGNNSTAKSVVPVQTIAAGSHVTAVAAGDAHSCAVVDGGAQCWGDNFDGQLGNGERFTQRNVPVQIIAAGSSVVAISAGVNHSCAVVAGGVQCWGANDVGQLGDGSMSRSLVPVMAIAAGSNATAIGAGQYHACAVVNGGVRCWGQNTSGALGNNSTAPSLVPVQSIAAGGGAAAISSGTSYSCAVVGADVQCWGYNQNGQLGNALNTASLIPVTAHLLSTAGPLDYSDMWWAGEAENGWGMSIQQHGTVQFNAFYVYDNAGKPTWYVMPGGTWNANFTAYSGALYQPTSAPLNNYTPAQFVVGASPGNATLTFTSNTTATLQYTINGISGQKAIQRQVFGRGTSPLAVGDMWWGGASQDGWGINLVQQAGIVFGVWYTYGPDGKPTWFVMPSGDWTGNNYSGTLYSTTGSAWLGATYNPGQLAVIPVGTMTFNFAGGINAVMNYAFTAGAFAGTVQSKPVVRQPY